MSKTSFIYLRVSPEEKEILVNIAKELHTDISKYMLQRALREDYTVTNVNEQPEIGSDICRIGNNINQIARGMNVLLKNYVDSKEIGLSAEDVEDLKRILTEFRDSLDKAKEVIEKYGDEKQSTLNKVMKVERKTQKLQSLCRNDV